MPRDLCFFLNQFPPSTWLYHYGHFKFFENLRRYSQLKVHHQCRWHRWQMEKIFNQKNFNYLVWTPLGSGVNIYIHFCHQGVCRLILLPYFATSVVDTGSKVAAGVVDIRGIIGHQCCWHRWQICYRCCWYRWCTLICEYLREFSKKFETVLMGYSGRGETDPWKKPEAKNLVTLSL